MLVIRCDVIYLKLSLQIKIHKCFGQYSVFLSMFYYTIINYFKSIKNDKRLNLSLSHYSVR